MSPLIFRAGVSASVILLYIFSVKLFNYYNRRHLQRTINSTESQIEVKQGLPTLLYFWAPNCVQCNSQELYLNAAVLRLQKREKEFNIKKINAHIESGIASKYRIVTVPTIVILDPDGKITSWNPGLMQPKKIISRLSFSQN